MDFAATSLLFLQVSFCDIHTSVECLLYINPWNLVQRLFVSYTRFSPPLDDTLFCRCGTSVAFRKTRPLVYYIRFVKKDLA